MAEKFKPISPQDLTGDLRAKVQEIEENWMGHPVVKNFHGRWKEYIAWFEGNQYVFCSERTGKLVDVSELVPREVKNVYNRILPMVRQMWGEIRYPHSFYVEPNTTEAEDIKAAKLGSSLIEYTNTPSYGKFHRKINFAKLWAIITGQAFWKEWWNKNLNGYIKGENGGTVRESGNLDFNYVNPFNVRPDPFAKSREGWRWFDEGKRVPKSMVEQEFSLEYNSLPAETKEGADTGLFERPEFDKPKEETIIRIEHWERPSSGYKKGRFMVVAGGWLLDDRDSPAPEADIPHFQIPGILPILNEQWYDSAVRIAQKPQQQLNRYGSMVDEHIENYRLKAIIPGGSLGPGEFERFTRAGVDYVKVTPGFAAPYWQSPPTLPEIIIRWLNFMESEFETESSVRKVSYAQLPKYAQRASGVLFEGLKGQDEAVLIPTADDINTSLEDAMKFRLQIAQKHYDVPRLIKITGKNKQTSTMFLKGVELRDNTDVRIRGGIELFSDKQAKREVVDTLLNKGYLKDARKALEILDVKGLEEFMEEEFIDENQAYRENDFLKEGKITPKASPDDNQEVHFRIHNNERKKEEFSTWPEDAQGRLLAHLEEHREFMAPPVEATAEAAPEEVAPAVAPMPTPAPMPAVPAEETITPEELLAIMALIPPEGGY